MNRKWTPASDEDFERQFAEATRRGRVAAEEEPRAIAAQYDRATGNVEVQLRKGGTFSFPAAACEGLSGAAAEELEDVRVIGGGEGLRWNSLDVDFGVPGLMAGRYGSRRWMQMVSEGRIPGGQSAPRSVPRRKAN